jgi:hypothetical protein
MVMPRGYTLLRSTWFYVPKGTAEEVAKKDGLNQEPTLRPGLHPEEEAGPQQSRTNSPFKSEIRISKSETNSNTK